MKLNDLTVLTMIILIQVETLCRNTHLGFFLYFNYYQVNNKL